ncbi:uncharacterized protein LOC109816274 [Cajanus cajan]|uniref:uncharacterized protein LOC109816274 n=1 Tax=Cajanus cajan TaxID=3821 RepID=UPI0010FB2FB1|nr:uncharacterized protein LOC109816274 [Cajanus cajan]
MGLNLRDIQLRFSRMIHVSVEISYTFIRRHPRVSGALLVFFILYIFLSYIYNLLAFLSPFFVCIAIFVRIFWSSEQSHLKSVNKEEKKEEKKKVESKLLSNVVKNERRGLLYKCPSHNATSRRRNFTGKKLDVYGGIEIKAKDLSSVFRNEFTRLNNDIRRNRFYKEEVGSLEDPTKQALFSEPSMLNFVTCGVGLEKKAKNKEDEKKAQEDGNKGVELTDDDQKNEMDLGTCELERHKRLESLIARRRARKQLKLQIENGLIDMKSVIPSQIAPLFITRLNPFDSPRGFDGIEMPGSAPSALRSPFDIPYDPFEEKPNLTGDSFDQELKNLLIEPRREDLQARESRLAHSRVRRLEGKGNDDKLEQPISKEDSENESKPSIPSSEEEETTHEEDKKCEIDNIADITGEEVDNVQATKSNSDHTSESNLIPMINVERSEVSEKLELPRVPKPQVGGLNLPISSTCATKINDSLYESFSPPIIKNQENMLIGDPTSHKPSCSLASDLQVEVSEVGSPTLTVDENHEVATTTDGESIIYDGDIDKDVTSGSEDMWGASLHLREVRRVSEQDISEINNWRDISSPLSLQNIDEENVADDSMSSRSDIPDDTPTYVMNSDHNNIFGNTKDFLTENGAPRPSHSPVVSSRWKRLMDNRVNRSLHEKNSKKPIELLNISENSSKSQVINDGNNSTVSEQVNTHNSRGDGELGISDSIMQQEATDEVSNNSSSSSSPRSVLSIAPKTTTDQVSMPTFNKETHLDVQQSNMQEIKQEILNEGPLDPIPQNIQPSIDDPNVESRSNDMIHPQEQTCPPENFIQESNISTKMNDVGVCNKEDENKLKNDETNGDKFTPKVSQDASIEPFRPSERMTSKDISEKSREEFDEKVPLISLILESSSEIQEENEENSPEEATMKPCINTEVTDTSSDEDFEGKRNNLNENEAMLSSCLSAGDTNKLKEIDKPKHSSEEGNYLQNESKQVGENHMDKEKVEEDDISKDSPLPITTAATNFKDQEGKCEKMNKNEATNQELNKNEIIAKSEPVEETDLETNINKLRETDKAKHSSEEVNYLQSESKHVVEDHMEKEKLVTDNISEDSPLPITTEVTNFEDKEGECEKMNNNEAIDHKLNNNEVIVISEPTKEINEITNIAHMKDLEEKTST